MNCALEIHAWLSNRWLVELNFNPKIKHENRISVSLLQFLLNEMDLMEVFEAIQKRHSVRSYLADEVPRVKLEKILEAARLAPSAGNIQPWHFIVVTDQKKRKKLSKGKYAKFLMESPVVIVGCGNKKASPNWYTVDTTIAMQNMVLTATSEGLGTCWIGSFNENQVRKLLNIPEKFGIIALLALGYRREAMDLSSKVLHFFRRRKKMEKITSLEEFENYFLNKKLSLKRK